MSLTIDIRFADGSFQQFSESEQLLNQLSNLEAQCFEGKEIIDRLFGDDWAAPPTFIKISGKLINGSMANYSISYD